MINLALLQGQLDHITRHPELWMQSVWLQALDGYEFDEAVERATEGVSSAEATWQVWTCGTAGCLAGNVVLASGYRPIWKNDGLDGSQFTFVTREGARAPGAESRSVRSLAQELLGLTEDQVLGLFSSQWETLPLIWAVAYVVTAGAVELPVSFPAFINEMGTRSPAAETLEEVREQMEYAIRDTVQYDWYTSSWADRYLELMKVDRDTEAHFDRMKTVLLPREVEEAERARYYATPTQA